MATHRKQAGEPINMGCGERSPLTGDSKRKHENPVVSQSALKKYIMEVNMELQDIKGKYKQINCFPNYYITEFGEIYSDRLRGNEIEPHLHRIKPKNPGRKNKYLNVVLCNEDGQITKSVHRLVAEYFVEGYFEGAVVNHIDGNNRNNIASNLEWTTARDNVIKSYKTSGVSAKRNYKIWELHSPDGSSLGVFAGNTDLRRFIIDNNLNIAPAQLIKDRNSRGYTVIVKPKQIENCNDYPKGVANG